MTAENPHAGQGSVLLDIGDDIGAVVVTMPAEMDGLEVEIRPAGRDHAAPSAGRSHGDANGHVNAHGQGHADGHVNTHGHGHDHDHAQSPWPHVAVVGRPTPGGVVYSLVFGEVREGRYELYLRPDGPVRLVVDVVGGRVTEASWPT